MASVRKVTPERVATIIASALHHAEEPTDLKYVKIIGISPPVRHGPNAGDVHISLVLPSHEKMLIIVQPLQKRKY